MFEIPLTSFLWAVRNRQGWVPAIRRGGPKLFRTKKAAEDYIVTEHWTSKRGPLSFKAIAVCVYELSGKEPV